MSSFDSNGNYNKTNWKTGDKITADKLNKIEESLEMINNNDIERHKEADKRLDTLEEQNEVIEEELNNKANKEELEEVNSQLAHIENEMHKDLNVQDISKYGIISINFDHKPPYTNEEYLTAYNNLMGLQKLFNDASERGINNIILPKGYYPICYKCDLTGSPHFSHPNKWCIRIPSHMIVDLNGSTIKVIYDSENKNPYDKSSDVPANLAGVVFRFDKTYKSVLRNGVIIGDRYDRAYSSATIDQDKGHEQTYGVRVVNGSRYCRVENMEICGFMGDAIQSEGTADIDLGEVTDKTTFTPGYIDSQGTYKTDKVGAYSTDFMECVNLKTNEIVLRTNIGYVYVPNFVNQTFMVSFYDENKNFLGQRKSEHLYTIIVYEGTKYIRLSIFDEEEGLESLSKAFQISTLPSTDFVVENVKIYDCNRGGMSNLPLDTLVTNCDLYNNGVTNNPKWVNFPDTTRYAINCEDTVVRSITIRNCYIHNAYNVLLLSAKKAVIENNIFELCDLSAVSLYNANDCVISNNQINRCGGILGLTDKGNKTVIIKNNICHTISHITSGKIGQHKVICDSNTIYDFVGMTTSDGVIMSNNLFISSTKHNDVYHSYNLGGRYINCDFKIAHPAYLTSSVFLNMDKYSNSNVFDVSGSSRVYLENVHNSTISGIVNGTLDNVQKGINVTNSNIEKINTIQVNFYGGTQIDPVMYSFTNSNIYDVRYFSVTSNASHTAEKMVQTTIVFDGCYVAVTEGTSRSVVFDIYINLYENQYVKVILKNSTFVNKSSKDNLNLYYAANPERVSFEVTNCTFDGITNNVL